VDLRARRTRVRGLARERRTTRRLDRLLRPTEGSSDARTAQGASCPFDLERLGAPRLARRRVLAEDHRAEVDPGPGGEAVGIVGMGSTTAISASAAW